MNKKPIIITPELLFKIIITICIIGFILSSLGLIGKWLIQALTIIFTKMTT